MSKIISFPNEPLIREQAGQWLARLDRGLSADERIELHHWLNEDLRHRGILFEMAELWDRMGVLGEIAGLFPLAPTPTRALNSKVWPAMLAAACVLVTVSVGIWSTFDGSAKLQEFVAAHFPESQPFDGHYRTQLGQQHAITLPDHSVITLNTDTEVNVHYTTTDRSIELISGEAHFAVAKDKHRVFRVRAGENEFNAVGTAFNIRIRRERAIELTVTEGRVKVLVVAAKQIEPMANMERFRSAATEIMVDAGKEVIIDRSVQTVEHLQPQKMDAATAWRRGMMVFDGEPLEQAVLEVSRYSNVNFMIAEPELKRVPVSGYFKIGDIDGLLAALHSNFDIVANKNGADITLVSASSH